MFEIDEELRRIIADENERVGWKEYAAHIRKGGAQDLSAQVSLAIAKRAFELGRKDCEIEMEAVGFRQP